ncbi:MAG: hypothetical protein GOV02_03570 [Candidatus Aenigmarchaeota archaeon]|nr:hypothetical protein [Candidatus Aenigmarchaeota archaeon]
MVTIIYTDGSYEAHNCGFAAVPFVDGEQVGKYGRGQSGVRNSSVAEIYSVFLGFEVAKELNFSNFRIYNDNMLERTIRSNGHAEEFDKIVSEFHEDAWEINRLKSAPGDYRSHKKKTQYS